MADRDKGTDVDKLLAEVDGMLTGGGTAPKRPVAPADSEEAKPGFIAAQIRAATTSGVVAAVAVFCVFAILPFLRAPSGAIGAFLGTFAAVFIFRRRR